MSVAFLKGKAYMQSNKPYNKINSYPRLDPPKFIQTPEQAP